MSGFDESSRPAGREHGEAARRDKLNDDQLRLLGDDLPLSNPVEDASSCIELDEEDGSIAGESDMSSYMWLVLGASLSGLMFGIDTAIISGTLVAIGTDLSSQTLSTGQKEIITSATTVGALIGSLLGGVGSDVAGRKPVLGLANVVFIAGAAIQAAAHTVWTMIMGRLVVGLGVGFAACVVPLYIGELAPPKLRGRLMTVNVLAITAGQVVAYAIGAAFQNVAHGWRYMVALSAVPAVGQLCAMVFLPESPRMLIKQNRHEAAIRALGKIYRQGTPEQLARRKLALQVNIKESLRIFENTTLMQRLRSLWCVRSNRRAMILAAGLQLLQQTCGFNSLMYYSSTLFAAIGFRNSTAVSSLVAIVNFIFTCIALSLIDKTGRRAIMLRFVPGMALSLALAAASFWKLTERTDHRLIEGAAYSTAWSGLVVAAMMAFVASYAVSAGSVPWTVQGEIFRLEVRGIGNSVATAVNWTGNLVVSASFLTLMERITPSGAFGLYSGVCALGWWFCYLCQPETMQLSLDDVCSCFEHDFGVNKSREIRRARAGHCSDAD